MTLTVTSKQLGKLSMTETVEFKTLAPPVGGSVQINPLQGYIGDPFYIILQDWTSANLPIEYNVYTTFDQAGSRKGVLINEDGPIPANEDFVFTAQRSTPIIVSVFDASGETLEFVLNPQISVRPDPADEAEEAETEEESNDTSTDDEEDDLPSP